MGKKIVFLLRVAIICGLCAALYLGWMVLEHREVKGEAEFLFAGTNDDADCTILLSGDYCVMVDTGQADDADHILELLGQRGVDKIDCLILTHPDQDHVGGAAQIIQEMPVQEVIVPYFDGEKEVYNTLMNQMQQLRLPVLTLTRDRRFTFGDLEIQLFPPNDLYYEKTNDYSLAALVKHGDVTMFMAGDAEKDRLQELLKLELPTEIDLYKTAHHGRKSTKNAQLIAQLKPTYAVVTAKAAEDEIQAAFDGVGTVVYSTLGRDVSFVSDGTQLSLAFKRPVR